MSGPLAGIKIVEFAGIGPGPMCAMLLADLGATVLRIDRKQPANLGIPRPLQYDTLLRNRRSIALDLKCGQAAGAALELIEQADAVLEAFRPGTMERLGLGPEPCLARNKRLVYGRMTGWGQDGPLSAYAGHDINYLAITGLLDAIGRPGQAPSIPLNVVGDYAGGALYLAVGMLAALLNARQTGLGQVVDAAIVDGAAHLSATFFGMIAGGIWQQGRGSNLVDGGAPFYDCYRCSDGKYVSVGPIESKFFSVLLRALNIDPGQAGPQSNKEHWADCRELLRARFLEKSRDEWVALLEHTDACVTGVLTFEEAPHHPHLQARNTYVQVDGVVQPAPAPRFSRTRPGTPYPPQKPTAENTAHALASWITPERLAELRSAGVLA
ncbi:CoA transferase [Bordetella petrii]|nr:CoA transferase [Bordetella petrii]